MKKHGSSPLPPKKFGFPQHGEFIKDFYYIERHASGRVGNCLLFWKEGDNGYSCDISEARKFTRKEARELIISDRNQKYTAWVGIFLDDISVMHINHQRLKNKMKLTV